MITIIFGLYLPGMTTFYKIDIPRILMKQLNGKDVVELSGIHILNIEGTHSFHLKVNVFIQEINEVHVCTFKL